eukprot:COSAG01_NODE_2062_length_8513_cov_8.566556_1_plen_80_part_00
MGRSKWNSIAEFIENSDKLWVNVGSGYAKPYAAKDDPRIAEMLSALGWFQEWRDDVYAVPISDRVRCFLTCHSSYEHLC